ncbi:hypothetical protein SK128_023944 [Halocaridina rubra]|uniref:Uncharacterized protein n=1 Tax=Halocaridina rubra TaxID=373956 RepID=A0AAN9ACV9_HALRR
MAELVPEMTTDQLFEGSKVKRIEKDRRKKRVSESGRGRREAVTSSTNLTYKSPHSIPTMYEKTRRPQEGDHQIE